MAGDTKIEWATKVWNPTVGCTVLTAGCAKCYAARLARTARAGRVYGCRRARTTTETIRMYTGVVKKSTGGVSVWTGKINLGGDEIINRPREWKKPERIFVNSMSDLFHKKIPVKFQKRVFRTMAECPQHTFMILTKRPEIAADFWRHLPAMFPDGIPQNIWLGTSAECDETLEERVPMLLSVAPRPAVLFLSAEPLLKSYRLG